MNKNNILTVKVLLVVALLAIMSGCKYDIAEPTWKDPYTPPGSPTISGIAPVTGTEIKAGANLITISGTGFSDLANLVYFNKLAPEVISNSATSIVVRRPNLVTDSCVIMVVSGGAYLTAKTSQYKIDEVVSRFALLTDATTSLGAITTDNAGNVYLVENNTSHTVFKILPAGDMTSIGVAGTAPVTDVKVTPDGKRVIMLVGQPRVIGLRIDGSDSAGVVGAKKPPKSVKCGDYDQNGYFYLGGKGSDLIVMAPDSTFKSTGLYASSHTITGIRVFGNYLYVVDTTSSSRAINRHSIDQNGNVGVGQSILDLTQNPLTSGTTVTNITFSGDGAMMYICTTGLNGLLVMDMASGKIDVMYKNIAPSYGIQITSGPASNYVYMIDGNSSTAKYYLHRINVGVPGAPSY